MRTNSRSNTAQTSPLKSSTAHDPTWASTPCHKCHTHPPWTRTTAPARTSPPLPQPCKAPPRTLGAPTRFLLVEATITRWASIHQLACSVAKGEGECRTRRTRHLDQSMVAMGGILKRRRALCRQTSAGGYKPLPDPLRHLCTFILARIKALARLSRCIDPEETLTSATTFIPFVRSFSALHSPSAPLL